jgi:hypothetical protein
VGVGHGELIEVGQHGEGGVGGGVVGHGEECMGEGGKDEVKRHRGHRGHREKRFWCDCFRRRG